MSKEELNQSIFRAIEALIKEKSELEGVVLFGKPPIVPISRAEATRKIEEIEQSIYRMRLMFPNSGGRYKNSSIRSVRLARGRIRRGKFLPLFYYVDDVLGIQFKTVRKPPGCALNAISEFIYSQRTYNRVFQPTISDLQQEYIEALSGGRLWKARWVRLRGYYSFFAAVVMQLPVSAFRLVVRIWKAAGN